MRELENVIERAVVLSRSDALGEGDLPDEIARGRPRARRRSSPSRWARRSTRSSCGVIRETLRHTKGDKSVAAQLLGISTRTIYRKLDGVPE